MDFLNRIADMIMEPTLDSLKNGSELTLTEDITLNDEEIEITSSNVVIDGDGHAIECDGDLGIFKITSDNVTLKNITLRNAHRGAISNLKGKLTLINCNFINCRFQNGNGGAIYNEATVIIENCDFRGCSSRFGGAIYNTNSVKVKTSNFSNNHASRGLSIFNKKEIILEVCNFTRNGNSSLENNFINNEIYNLGIVKTNPLQKSLISELTHGGFIHIMSDENGTFKDLNEMLGENMNVKLSKDIIMGDEDDGIVIDRDNMVIDGEGFRIDGLGKGIILTVKSKATVKNITFANGAGAIDNEGELCLINCNFENNIRENGGAIKNEGIINAEGCCFNSNIANDEFGGAIDNYGALNLIDCKFNRNMSLNFGGAISNSQRLTLSDCDFASNLSERGACIHNDGTLRVGMCDFKNNKAFKQGSILYNDDDAAIKGGTSSNNISNRNSNVIYQNKNRLKIEGCKFVRDTFNNNLIHVKDGECEIRGCTFDIKNDYEHSYVIYAESDLEMEGNEFNTDKIIYRKD